MIKYNVKLLYLSLNFFFFIYLYVSLISSRFDAPVEKMMGLLKLNILSIKGLFVISAEAILKYFTSLFKKSAELLSKGVDKKSTLYLSQIFFSFV